MSKGSRAVCMRFPEPLIGNIEAEARARGISVPELCRRIIAERNQAVEGVKALQVTPSPRLLTNIDPSESPRIEAPTPTPVNVSQKAEAVLEKVIDAAMWADITAKFPELSPPTEAQKRAREALVKLAEKHPEELAEMIAEQFARGEMSEQELIKFLELLGA